MLQIYCPTCHGRVKLEAGETTAVCESCGNIVPVPRGYTELESAFNYAMEARIRRDFSAAESAYTDILSNHSDLAAAFWGRALSRYGVEYQPIGDGEYRLVCHKAVMSDFSRDADVTTAIALSGEAEQESYVQETQKISALQNAVSKYAAVSAPCDVLVIPGAGTGAEKVKSVKTMLSATGCSVFVPALELASTPRQDWEPMLSRAFSTAHTMVLIAVGKNAFTAEVQFDAERFLYRKAQQQRDAQAQVSQLVIAFDDLDEYDDIPDTIFDGADVRVPMAAPDFAEELCRLVSENGANYDSALRQEASGHENFEYTNLINNANRVLKSGDFLAATERFDQILNYNPRESQAYWGSLLAKYQCRDESELIQLGAYVLDESSYKNAISFASERERQIYEDIARQAHDKYDQGQKEKQEKVRIAKEREKNRTLNEEEVASAKETKKAEEQKEKHKSKRRRKLVVFLMIVAAVAGVIFYYVYSQTSDETRKLYRQAQDLYNSGSYMEAADVFSDLGDYKDSKIMYSRSIQTYEKNRYNWAIDNGDNIECRLEAISAMQSALHRVYSAQVAQEYLDKWLQEGEDYYNENGADYMAFQLLKGFGTDSQAFINLWRDIISAGIVNVSDDYDVLVISQEDGKLYYNECEGLEFEDGSAKSASLSTSGDSAAVVRADGTVYVTGTVAEKVDVSGWSNVKSVQTTDDEVVALTNDGTLLSSKRGTVATEIRQFNLSGDMIIAARLDNTVFCTDKDVENAVSDWPNVVYVAVSGTSIEDIKVLGITVGNVLRRYGFGEYEDYRFTDDIIAVVHNGMRGADEFSTISFDSEWFLVACGDPADIQVTIDGEATITQIKNDDRDIQLRNFVRDLPAIGIPNLEG